MKMNFQLFKFTLPALQKPMFLEISCFSSLSSKALIHYLSSNWTAPFLSNYENSFISTHLPNCRNSEQKIEEGVVWVTKREQHNKEGGGERKWKCINDLLHSSLVGGEQITLIAFSASKTKMNFLRYNRWSVNQFF